MINVFLDITPVGNDKANSRMLKMGYRLKTEMRKMLMQSLLDFENGTIIIQLPPKESRGYYFHETLPEIQHLLIKMFYDKLPVEEIARQIILEDLTTE